MEDSLLKFIIYVYLTCFLSFTTVCVFIRLTTKKLATIVRTKEEKFYFDHETKDRLPFPSLDDDSTIHLSVIVPAYNEEERLPVMLDECLLFLESRGGSFKYEVIVVSDGSSDKTVDVAMQYVKKYGSDKVRVLELVKNRGKGGAVRLGMLSARGALLLFADADGASKFSDIVKLENSLKTTLKNDYLTDPNTVSKEIAISIGSRAHLQDEAVASRSVFRTFLMYGFHTLVWMFAVRNIKDTQCGFKLFTRQSARICFRSMHVERWAFDVEILYIAQRLKIPIMEVAVNWTEIDGSKVTPVWSWIQMGKDLGLIWLRYRMGAWELVPDKQD